MPSYDEPMHERAMREDKMSRMAPISEPRVDQARMLVDEMRARSEKYMAECSEHIDRARQELEHWSRQREIVVEFLSQDVLMSETGPNY